MCPLDVHRIVVQLYLAAEKGRTKIVQSRWRERKKWLWRFHRTNSCSWGGTLRDSEVVAGSSGRCKCKMQKWTNFTAAHAEQRKDTQTVQLTVDHYAGAALSREKRQWLHTLAMYHWHGNSPSCIAPATEDDAEVNAKRTDNSFTTLYTAVHGSVTWNGSL